MITDAIWLTILSATLGALAAGLFRTLLDWRDRSRNCQSVLKAFAGEVGILCWIIRYHYHPDRWRMIADRIERGQPARLVLDLSQNYFVMHECLLKELGSLRRDEAATITEFYTLCKIAIDTVGVRSVYSGVPQNMRFAADIIELALRLGDRILLMPRDPKPISALGAPYDWTSALAEASRPSSQDTDSDAGPESVKNPDNRSGGMGRCPTV